MNEQPSIADELAAVTAAMPGPHAEPAELAAWLRRRAAVLRRIATETGDTSAADLAERYEEHAVELDAEQVLPVSYPVFGQLAQVHVMSFGYLWHPNLTQVTEPTITIDLRKLLHNPHQDPAMRQMTGLDQPVREHVLATPGAAGIIAATATLTITALAQLEPQHRVVQVAFGCAGGRHRSVVLANELRRVLTDADVATEVTHLDVLRPVYQHQPEGGRS